MSELMIAYYMSCFGFAVVAGLHMRLVTALAAGAAWVGVAFLILRIAEASA